MSKKEFVHVVLPDDSVVTRQSTRPYRYAVCRKGALVREAEEILTESLLGYTKDQADYEKKAWFLKVGVVVKREERPVWLGADRIVEEFTLGIPDVEGAVVVKVFQGTFEEQREHDLHWAEVQAKSSGKKAKQIDDALRHLALLPTGERVTTSDAERFPALGYLRPGVYGFSQTLKNAEARALTEAKRIGWGHVSDVYTVPVAKGRPSGDHPKGRKL